MKLFLLQIKFKRPHRGRRGVEAVVHAKSKKAAEQHLASRFTGATIESSVELENIPKHFIVADLSDE